MRCSKTKKVPSLDEYRPKWMDEDWAKDPSTIVFTLPDPPEEEKKKELIQLELFNFEEENERNV